MKKKSPEECLDDMAFIRSVDTSRLFKLIDNFPEQIENAVNSFNFDTSKIGKIVEDSFSQVGIVGVGTAKVCAEVLKTLSDRMGIKPIFFINEFSLPCWVDSKTLLFFVSFSGNTEEVISCFDQLVEHRCTSIVITSGGHLEQKALSIGVPIVKIKKEFPPNRTVFPYMIVPVILTLNVAGYLDVNGRDLIKVADFLKEKRALFSINKKTSTNIAKQTALYLYNRIPLLYTDESLYSGVILRWQYQLNENAKVLAHSARLPEMSHNEVVGLQGSGLSSISAPLFIFSEDKREGACGRMAFTRSILEGSGYSIRFVGVPGKNDLEKIFCGILMGDYVSFYLAIGRGVDPHAVDAIDSIRLQGNTKR